MPPSATNGKICYVEIPTGDVEASAAFYREVFGLPIQHEDEDTAMFRVDDTASWVSTGLKSR